MSRLSDDELLKMVTIDSGDYRQEALVLAKDELRGRGFVITRMGIDFDVITPDGIKLKPLNKSTAEPVAAPRQHESVVERAGKADPFIKRLLMSPVVFVGAFIGGVAISSMITQIIRLSGGGDIVGYRTNTPTINGFIIMISMLLGVIAVIIYQIRFSKRNKAKS